MFALYGISGPTFQGPLEGLSRLPPVVARPPVVAARRVEAQAEAGVAPREALGEPAVNAYKAMLPQNLERGPLYHANQIMQRYVITVRLDDPVARAWRALVDNRIHQAPVLDSAGHLVGIVSERNLLTALNVDAGAVRDVMAKRVGDVMSTPVVAASPVTDIRRIARVMLERDVEGVPIVGDAGNLVGFISQRDILRAVVSEPPLSIWR